MIMKQIIFSSIDELIDVLSDKSVMLVCGGSYDKLEISKKLNGLKLTRFSGFTPNPVYEDVCKGVELFKEKRCDAILAVGGGSATDVAKCIKLFCKMNTDKIFLEQEYADTGIPLAVIPTTAGTGSESTRHAVIYLNGIKQSVSHVSIVPDYACLIPSVLDSLPVYQKKCTMLDALCQAIESWWSRNATAESIEYSRRAIELIRDNFDEYISNYSPKSAEKMLLASNYSGRAINITATTAPHAMSYKLTSLYGIPHGHAVGICLPEVWKYMLKQTEKSNTSELDKLRQVFSELPINIDWYVQLLKKLEIDSPTASDREKEIEILVSSVNQGRLKNNPVALTECTLKSLYERIVK